MLDKFFSLSATLAKISLYSLPVDKSLVNSFQARANIEQY